MTPFESGALLGGGFYLLGLAYNDRVKKVIGLSILAITVAIKAGRSFA
jgi:multisubunit Na+/H+ antiporter MnhC subunit